MPYPLDAPNRIRDKMDAGLLPHDAPPTTMHAHFGMGALCDGCDEPILPAQVQYEFDADDGRVIKFHLGCAGLWEAYRRVRGWAKAVGVSATLLLAGGTIHDVPGRSKAEKFYDDWNQQRRSRWQKSPAIRDAFPGVETVRINVTFDDSEKVGNPQPKQLTLGPEQKAFFDFACPFRECVRGGFDLSPAVRDVVRSQATSARGERVCQGWENPERFGKRRCWLRAQYEIRIKYGNATFAPTLAFVPIAG